jgi:hypothetical protein
MWHVAAPCRLWEGGRWPGRGGPRPTAWLFVAKLAHCYGRLRDAGRRMVTELTAASGAPAWQFGEGSKEESHCDVPSLRPLSDRRQRAAILCWGGGRREFPHLLRLGARGLQYSQQTTAQVICCCMRGRMASGRNLPWDRTCCMHQRGVSLARGHGPLGEWVGR